MDHILIASDLSPRADRAVHRGVRLARAHRAAVTVLTVVDDAWPKDMADAIVERAEVRLARFVDHVAVGVEARPEVVLGDPTAAILAMVDNRAPDLLVLGTHRQRPFLDTFYETTVQRIVRNTACPVLLVLNAADHDYSRIVAALDFSPAATTAIQTAHRLAPDAEIRPIHALHVPYAGILGLSPDTAGEIERSFRQEAAAEVADWKDAVVVPDTATPVEIVAGPIGSVVLGFVRHVDAELLCLGAHGRVGARRAFLGSFATDLIRDPPCDLLLARPAANDHR